jgi:hypothetical protein
MTTAAARFRAPAGQQGSGNQVCRPLRRGALSRTAQCVVPRPAVPLGTPS